MEWYFFAFLAALLAAASAVTQKKILCKQHAMEFSASLAVVTFVFALPLFVGVDFSSVELFPLILLFFITILAAFAFFFVAKATRHMEISSVSPLLVAGPGFVAVAAFFILGESISLFQVFGILLLVLGAYVLELRKHHGFLEPFRIVKKSKYIHYIIFALVLYSLAATGDRYILGSLGMDFRLYVAFAHLFLVFHFLVMISVFHNGIEGIRNGFRRAGWWIVLVAFFTVGYRLSQSYAIQTTEVALVSAIKRTAALFVVVIGGELFHEKYLLRKAIACLIMIAGVLLIVL